MTDPLPRIGIVEDDAPLRRFLAGVIESSPDFTLAFDCGCKREALEQLATGPVDLCLVDIGLPDGSGIDVIRQLKSTGRSRALVLSVLGDRVTVMQALSAGADGYILKSGRPSVILNEIRQTLDGLAPVSPQIAAYLLDLVRPEKPQSEETDPGLSERELEVLDLFARGLSYRETAELLGISVNTISDHVRNIYAKLSVHSRSEAIFEAQSMGLISGGAPVKTGPPRE